MPHSRLILTGFMGSGKSTVGRLCARRLNYEFLDTDLAIEAQAGMSIPQIFEQHGEAYFRALEAAVIEDATHRERVVISVGGGAIVNADNRAKLLQSGMTVCLMATPEALLERTKNSTRPLLQTEDPLARIKQLMRERAPAYRAMRYQIDTTSKGVPTVTDEVLALFNAEQQRIRVQTPNNGDPNNAGGYDIVIGNGLLDALGYMLASRGYAPPVAVITDTQVNRFYARKISDALNKASVPSFVHTVLTGESHKNLLSVERIYFGLAKNGVERNGVAVALGGGVIGDMTGFAAATYLRGIPFVQVPTSLLAMVDSSIGGKTGVDAPFGKNMVGAFKQPDLVVIDTACLATLPQAELSNGFAEIIKAALIKGGVFWNEMCAGTWQWTNRTFELTHLTRAIELKREIVEEDPFERGRRALLNLGHTFGHGIEFWSHFKIAHGQAVALGMICAVRASIALGLCDPALEEQLIAQLKRAGLPIHMKQTRAGKLDVDATWKLMQNDKKKKEGKVRFVLIRAPGDCFVSDQVDEALAKRVLATLNADDSKREEGKKG